ncbi:MAG: hypothetical protein N3C60_04925 [Calditerrivibrio sp.]|nr:hypothetical protein [Calditerrivibrio sp.]
MFERALMIFVIFLVGCAAHDIEIKGEKVIFSLKYDNQTYFHYSLDGFVPHKMAKNGSRYYFELKKTYGFKYFFTDGAGVIKIECPLVEFDDFGNYNCIFEM